jgi:hypothetical protein
LVSAAYSIALEKLGTQPGYLVAGALYIGDKRRLALPISLLIDQATL